MSSHEVRSASCTSSAAPGFRDKFGPVVDSRGEVIFQDLKTRDLLNRLTYPGMPFGWTANPYRGCEIGCAYCYARPTHEYLGQAGQGAFEHVIFVKRAELGLLRERLRAARASDLEIAIGTATDPYQPGEARFGVTRQILNAVRDVGGLRVSITTKGGVGILRDLELLRSIAERSELMVNTSLISLDANLLRRLEPRAPRPDLRLRAMNGLARAGIPARLFAMPVLPYLTDGEADLRALIAAARRAGAGQVVSNALFRRGATKSFFLDWLDREKPELAGRYRELYRGSAYVSRVYRERLEALVNRLAKEEGIQGRTRAERIRQEAPARPRQLALEW